ncbi:hypothetical protein EX30DRAFT_364363 [Ascodesmis nigricans]|uniref:RING-type E3 ubiquitin transferase (cysteine targeting) n=1 Tax=Ascodesmis nigricans TaxID=341454 RepID=A0A4S2MVQ4_9PEZI|nr:hypothetical protein EX30DRAFT_364363 [Ascodesmis nigricans]
MASATTSRLAAPAIANSPPADWQIASRAAQDRIIQLQQQRAREASSNPSRIRSFFAGETVKPSFRVGQLDTELLDEELLELLKGQLWGGLKYFRPSIKENWEPELLLVLRAALFKLTIWDHNASYGAALQNLRYTDARKSGPIDYPPSKTQKSLYGLVTVGGRYLYSRLNLFLLAHSDPYETSPSLASKLSNLVDKLGSLHSALTLISFTAFLLTGHYRTLLDRILRMRLVTPNRAVAREVSFEYLNRQLVWHAFTEFLLFILPLLRIGRWRRWWARFLRKVRSENGPNGEATGELAFLPDRTCAICYKETDAESAGAGLGGGRATDITNPYEAVECGHVYCYVCIAGKIELEEGEGWTCLRCGTIVKRCKPWMGDVEGLATGDWGEDEDAHGKRHSIVSAMSSRSSVSSDEEVAEHMIQTDLLDELQDGDDEENDDDEHEDEDEEDEEDGGYHRLNTFKHGEEEDEDEDVSEAESEETQRPLSSGRLTADQIQWPEGYDAEGLLDDSQYNTAEDYE